MDACKRHNASMFNQLDKSRRGAPLSDVAGVSPLVPAPRWRKRCVANLLQVGDDAHESERERHSTGPRARAAVAADEPATTRLDVRTP